MRSKQSGFTLIETVVSLSIVIAGIVIIEMFLPLMHPVSQHYYDSTRFYSCLSHWENRGYRVVDCHKNCVHLYLPRDSKGHRKFYSLRRNGQILYLSGENGGYIPIMNGVESVTWQYHSPVLITRLKLTDGTMFKSRSLFSKFTGKEPATLAKIKDGQRK